MKYHDEKDLAVCGLACVLCSEEDCPGCKARGCKAGNCSVYRCAAGKGLDGCYLCEDFPCGKKMLAGTRSRAFNRFAREFGKQALLSRLKVNWENGVTYHRIDGHKGDYDMCETEQEIIDLLKNGRPDPYARCPNYEGSRFLLRLVTIDDAADLLKCYKNPSALVQTNALGCEYGYGAQTLEEMQNFIEHWLADYDGRNFVRFSIIDKFSGAAVGTIELYDKGDDGHSFLRIDLSKDREGKEQYDEILQIVDRFFRDFDCRKIVVKAPAGCRDFIKALHQNGYAPYPANQKWEYHGYYIKRLPQS